jgi:hypothetical protein
MKNIIHFNFIPYFLKGISYSFKYIYFDVALKIIIKLRMMDDTKSREVRCWVSHIPYSRIIR